MAHGAQQLCLESVRLAQRLGLGDGAAHPLLLSHVLDDFYDTHHLAVCSDDRIGPSLIDPRLWQYAGPSMLPGCSGFTGGLPLLLHESRAACAHRFGKRAVYARAGWRHTIGGIG